MTDGRSSRDRTDPFGSALPAWRVAKLRNSLKDAELRGKLGEPLPDSSHRAVQRRWIRGRGDKAAITVPTGRLGGEIARNIGRLRHALETAGATDAERAVIEQACAAIAAVAGDVATRPAGRAWKPRKRGVRGPGKVRHPAAGRRAELLDEAVRLALPDWTDGMPLPHGGVAEVCRQASECCNREGFARPSQSRIRAWLNHRAKPASWRTGDQVTDTGIVRKPRKRARPPRVAGALSR